MNRVKPRTMQVSGNGLQIPQNWSKDPYVLARARGFGNDAGTAGQEACQDGCSIKVAMVTHTFLPQFFGGREKHVLYLSKELTKKGFEVCIFTGNRNKRFECGEYEGIMTYRFPLLTLNFPADREKIPYRIVPPHSFIKVLREYDPDIVHAHDHRHFTTDIAAFYCEIANKPFILTVHGFFYNPGCVIRTFMKLYDETLGQLSLRTANKIIYVSKKLAEEHMRGKLKNKIIVVPNGTPAELGTNGQKGVGDFRQRHGLESDDKIILAVGRLSAQKGFRYLITAYKKIMKRNGRYRLCIVGPETSYAKELERLAENTDSIVFTRSIPENELRDAYLAADLFVLSSLAEGCPITLLEAMAFGKPVVATSVGMVPEIIRNEVNGILVQPGNSDLLAEAITKVLDDDGFARNLGKNAKMDAMKNWRDFISKTQDAYESVFNRRRFGD